MALLLKQAPTLKFIPNYIYFYHLDEYCILPLYPDQITDNMTSTFQQTNSLSRSAPVFTFSNSGPRNVRIDLDLHRDLINDLNKNKTIAEMPDNVNNAILEIIGIGKKEFTKCIALPQGEFDRFLSDTPAIRKKTLAKLFDLEQFGVYLSEKLKKRKSRMN